MLTTFAARQYLCFPSVVRPTQEREHFGTEPGHPNGTAANGNGKRTGAPSDGAASARSVTRAVVSSSDGRILKGERTRRAIAQAMIDLVEQGDALPTGRSIAERAGVSLRLVFHHFEDVDEVFQKATELQDARYWSTLPTVPPGDPLASRITATSRARRRLFEAITPVRRVACIRSQHSPAITRHLAAGRARLRDELAATFAPELASTGGAGDRSGATVLLDSLDVAAGWEAWCYLRNQVGRTATASERAARLAMTSLLTVGA